MRIAYTKVNPSGIPSEYTELDYIQSSGTQYIDTGIVTTANFGCDLDFAIVQDTNMGLFGGRNDYTTKTSTLFYISDNYKKIRYDFNQQQFFDITTNVGEKYNFKSVNNGTNYIFTQTSYLTGQTSTFTKTKPTTVPTVTQALFAVNTGDSVGIYAIAKIYRYKMYNGSTLIRDFIPCKNSSNIVGMYDLVTDTFFTNQGTGTFTAGNVVSKISKPLLCYTRNIPSGYKELEYIQSTGTQYIDTGVAFNSATDKVIAEFFSSETGNYKWSFGAYSSPNGIGVTSGGNWSNDLFYYTPYTVSSSLLKNTKHTFTADTNGCYVDTTKVSSYRSFSIPNTLYLFGCNTGSESSANRSSSTIYSFKFYRSNVLLRDYIPCQRLSDNEIGMYDRVTDTFYGNAGSGTFTAGNEVKPTLRFIETGV